jgi:hypothetical protein
LPSQYLRQVAQALVVDLDGVRTVVNQITVEATIPRWKAHLQERAIATDAPSEDQ